MIHPIPPGTRDVLADEMRELRALTETMRARFESAGYREVSPPTMQHEEALRSREGGRGGGGPRQRGRARRGLPAVRRARRGAGAGRTHDDPDRARGGPAL